MLVNLVRLMRISSPFLVSQRKGWGGGGRGWGHENTPVMCLLLRDKRQPRWAQSLVRWMMGKMFKVSLQAHSKPSGGWSQLTVRAPEGLYLCFYGEPVVSLISNPLHDLIMKWDRILSQILGGCYVVIWRYNCFFFLCATRRNCPPLRIHTLEAFYHSNR